MSELLFAQSQTKQVIGSWHMFSASKLIQLYECPLAFYFRYFLHQNIVQTPSMVFGSALHHLFDQFFRKNYKSPQTFAATWKYYWLGLCDGRFGEHGMKSSPIVISFRDREQKGNMLGFGINIVKKFYEDNLPYRQTALHPQTEVSFAVPFRGYKIRGFMDRLQPIDEENTSRREIWDYKPRLPELANLRNDIQLTIYDHAYRVNYNQEPVGMRIYSYKSASKTDLVYPRQDKYFDELESWLRQAHAYIFGVLFWRHYQYLPNNFRLEDFGYFSRSDVERGVFSPRYFPNSNHCKFCSFYKDCEERRANHQGITIADELLQKLANDRQAKLLSKPEKKETRKQQRAKYEMDLFPTSPFEELSEFVGQRLDD